MTIYRGDIYYVTENFTASGAEMRAGRPAIIVSANHLNAASRTVEVVWLTTAPRYESDMHVSINSTARASTAVCEQVTSISVERLGNFVAQCTPAEMSAIDKAIAKCLGLEATKTLVPFKTASTSSEIERLNDTIKELTIQKDLYKAMYDELVGTLTRR